MNHLIAAWQNEILKPLGKLKVHQLGLRHPAVSVFVKRGDEILLQQRAAEKYHSPELWANTVCTHPHWGESDESAATRRLSEELGINNLELEFRSKIEYRADVGNGLIEHELVSVFLGEVAPGFDLKIAPNPSEVLSTRWENISMLKSEINRSPNRFTAWFKIYLNQHSNDIF